MQVTNRKQRANAKWRFAGLYILSLAIPVFLFMNTYNMGEVECKENEQLVEQLRKRDEALAELSRLSAILYTAQKLMPVYGTELKDEEQAKYDQLKFKFGQGVERLKNLYYQDTALYSNNYSLVSFLVYNQNEYDRIRQEFWENVKGEKVDPRPDSEQNTGGGGNKAEIMILNFQLREAHKKIKELEDKLANCGKGDTSQFADLRSRAEAIDANIDEINNLLGEIEEDANKIQRRDADNLIIKKKIIDRARNLRNYTTNIKNSNNILISMAATTNQTSTE